MKPKRYSRQRELIHTALMETKDHPTADMLYERLKPENPGLSLGTVYRNLKQLVEEGSAVRLNFPVERFDARTEAHHHMKCTRCGRVFDVALPYDATLDRQASDLCGHEITGHELLFYGTCEECLETKLI